VSSRAEVKSPEKGVLTETGGNEGAEVEKHSGPWASNCKEEREGVSE
jgi:hypothetical protein